MVIFNSYVKLPEGNSQHTPLPYQVAVERAASKKCDAFSQRIGSLPLILAFGQEIASPLLLILNPELTTYCFFGILDYPH